jgi:hypothetical protein
MRFWKQKIIPDNLNFQQKYTVTESNILISIRQQQISICPLLHPDSRACPIKINRRFMNETLETCPVVMKQQITTHLPLFAGAITYLM